MEDTDQLYLAAPLFNKSEREFNAKLKKELEPYFEVYLPQDDGDLLTELIERGVKEDEAVDYIFRQDVEEIVDSDILVIVLDGMAVDAGAAFELGLAYAENKVCVGLQTDSRRLLPTGNNPMLEGACDQIFKTTDELVNWAKRRTQQRVNDV